MQYLFFVFLFVFTFQLNAQSYTIKASVLSDDNAKLEIGDALILNAIDSSMITGAPILSGDLIITGVTVQDGILKVRSTGCEPAFIPFLSNGTDTLLLDDITLKQIEMDGLEVVAFRPTFKYDGDKIVVDVENSGMASSGTVIDLLRKSPGVLVDGSNNVSIFGRGAARIYIDGQLMTDNSILQSISSQEIKSIEVIKNPGAEYDAEGQGGVINIITKNANLEGVSGSVYGSYSKAGYWFSNGGGRINYKKNKLSLSASYNAFFGKRGATSDYFRTIYNPGNNLYFDNSIVTTRNMKNNSNLRLGAEYQIDSLNTVGLQWKSTYSSTATLVENTNLISDDFESLTALKTQTNSDFLLLNNGLNLRHKYKNDSTGSSLITSIDYTLFSSDDKGSIIENITGVNVANNDKQSMGTNKIQLVTGKIDYNKKVSEKWSFASGAKYYSTGNSSNALFQKLNESGEWTSDSSLTNGYTFNEDVGALYVQSIFKHKKLNGRIGLRGERTQNKGTSKLTGQNVIDTTYYNVFPTAYFGVQITDDLVWGFNYTTRFNRPSFQDLNPFVDYIDSVSAFVGNPFLLPEYAHKIQTSLIFKEYASLEVGYTRVPNEVLTIVERSPVNNAFLVQDQNINYGEVFNVDLVLPYQTKGWTTYNGFGYSFTRYNFYDNGELTNLSIPSFYFYFYNEVNLPKNFSIQGTFYYSSKGLEGIFQYNAIYGLQATITKKAFKEKLTISVSANDILQSYAEQGKSNLEGFEVQYNDRYDTRFITFGLSYNFGKLKNADSSDKAGNKEESDRIKGD